MIVSETNAQIKRVSSKNLYLKLGSAGLGLGYQQRLSEKLLIGAELSHMDFRPTISQIPISGNRILKLKLSARFTDAQFFLCWYPKGIDAYAYTDRKGFYIKAGAAVRIQEEMKLGVLYQRDRGYRFNNNDTVTSRIITDIQLLGFQPFVYMGLPLSKSESKWNALFEWGFNYHGRPVSDYTLNLTKEIPNMSPEGMTKRLNKLQIYPVLQLLISYKLF